MNNGANLTIEAGVAVNLNNYFIQVEGTLQARGGSADPIRFKLGGIKFLDSSNDWNEQNGSGCIIENAVTHSSFSLAAFHIEDASPKLNNNTIGPNVGYPYAIEVRGGSPTITKNTIYGPVGLLYSGSARCDSLIPDNVISTGSEGI